MNNVQDSLPSPALHCTALTLLHFELKIVSGCCMQSDVVQGIGGQCTVQRLDLQGRAEFCVIPPLLLIDSSQLPTAPGGGIGMKFM